VCFELLLKTGSGVCWFQGLGERVPNSWSSSTECSLPKLCPHSWDNVVSGIGRAQVVLTGVLTYQHHDV